MMHTYLRHMDGTIECGLSVESVRNALSNPQELLWVDIEDPEDEEIELLLEVFELHPLTVEDCIMPNARPKLEEFEKYLFVILQGLSRIDGVFKAIELDVCLGRNFLVTVHSCPIKSLEDDQARIERKSPVFSRGADFLFYATADSLMNSYFPILDDVDSKVDVLETKMLKDSTEQILRELLDVYNEIMMLRRTLGPHREVLARLTRGDLPFIAPANVIYFRDISDRLLRMSDLADSCREIAAMALEVNATIASNRLNEIMKTMTAFATLSLPLIVITGVFGMNFGEHPALGPRWIYYILSLGLLGSIPVMVFFFRRYRWL